VIWGATMDKDHTVRYQQALQEGKLVVTIHAPVLSCRVVASPREQSNDLPEIGDGIGTRLTWGGGITGTDARKQHGALSTERTTDGPRIATLRKEGCT